MFYKSNEPNVKYTITFYEQINLTIYDVSLKPADRTSYSKYYNNTIVCVLMDITLK